MSTFRAPLVHAARHHGDRVALVDVVDGRSCTFTELLDRVERIGGLLDGLGVAPGDRVAVLADGCADYAALYLAIPAHGRIVVPLNTRYAAADLEAAVRDCQPTAIFTDRTFDPGTAALVGRVLPIGPALSTLLASVDPRPMPRGDEDEIAAIFYTGGTTDRAKGVALSHRNKLADALSLIVELDLSGDDRWLVMSPMFHAAGSFNVVPCVWVGATQVFLPRFDAESVLRAVPDHAASITFGVPTMVQALVEARARVPADLSSLRLLGHGGAPMTQALLQRTVATFPSVEICGMYGATEMAPLATVLRHQERLVGTPLAGSVGRAVIGVEVDVVDDRGEPGPAGVPGEIVVTGPNIMRGYWNKPEATEAVLSGRSYRSGDVGRLDERGYLFVVDRSKDMIITGGENVYPAEVEDVLAAHDAVVEVAVVGLPDERWGEVVVAVVVVHAPIDTAVLDGHCRAQLAGYKVPRRYEQRSEPLPRTGAGKVLKRTLRAELAEPGAPPSSAGAVGGRRIGPSAHWEADDRIPISLDPIGEVLADMATRFGERPALLWPDDDGGLQAMSYGELRSVASAAAGWIAARTSPGDRVAVWSRNSVEWMVLFYACALSGTVITPLNTAWTDPEVDHAIGLTAPALLFAGADTRGVSLQERARGFAGRVDVVDLERVTELAATGPQGPLPSVTHADPFLIQFTSGTTGRAKGALLSHRAALNAGRLRSLAMGATERDVWLNPVPLHHVGGSCGLALAVLSVGGAYTVLGRFDPALLVRLLTTTGATRIGGVPTMLLGLIEHPDFPSATNVRAVGLGGASVPPSLVRRVQEAFPGATASVVFGQSENPIITSTGPGDDVETIATTVGIPLPGAEVKIVDPTTGATVPVGEVGEIVVRSPLQMDGYFRMPDATAEVIDADGFLHTGDLASMDERGVVRVHGRAREVIIRGGENIYPAEVEDALLQHPAVANAAVIGLPDDRWGQVVAAVVLLTPEDGSDGPTSAELEAFAGERIAHFKIPRTWRFVDTLPLTASGKVRKVELDGLFR